MESLNSLIAARNEHERLYTVRSELETDFRPYGTIVSTQARGKDDTYTHKTLVLHLQIFDSFDRLSLCRVRYCVIPPIDLRDEHIDPYLVRISQYVGFQILRHSVAEFKKLACGI